MAGFKVGEWMDGPGVAPKDGTGMFRRHVQIPVDVKLDGEVYVATSPLVPGLVVVNKSREALFVGVENAMRDLTESYLKEWDLERAAVKA